MNLRKEKSAILKLAILDHTVKLIGSKSFDEVRVDEICRKTKISKVTLFKYFPQKEDIMLYYFRVWSLRRLVQLKEKPREGLDAIQYLFDRMSEEFEAHPGIILSWVGYLSQIGRTMKPFPLKAEEKKILFPDVKEIHLIELQSLDQMIEKFALEAIFKKEITKSTSTRDIANTIVALFYGSILNAHVNQVTSAKMFFRKNLEILVKGLS